jgi:hypothetical protein
MERIEGQIYGRKGKKKAKNNHYTFVQASWDAEYKIFTN